MQVSIPFVFSSSSNDTISLHCSVLRLKLLSIFSRRVINIIHHDKYKIRIIIIVID